MVLTDEGEVLSFGSGAHGRLGHGDAEDQLVPTVIAGLQANSRLASRLFASLRDLAAQADAKLAKVFSDVYGRVAVSLADVSSHYQRKVDVRNLSARDFLSTHGADGLAFLTALPLMNRKSRMARDAREMTSRDFLSTHGADGLAFLTTRRRRRPRRRRRRNSAAE